MNQLELQIQVVLDQLQSRMPLEVFAEVQELVKTHGEYGIAMELLCSALEEYSTALDSILLDRIIDIFKAMQFSDDQVNYYKAHLTLK